MTDEAKAANLEPREYSAEEKRVGTYLNEIAPDVGWGDDPLGFLIASHRYRNAEFKERGTEIATLTDRLGEMERERAKLWAYIAQKQPSSKADCDHAGYRFDLHGRCCFKCGTFVTDFGD